MKKNYMRPESMVMKIEMISMIATSDPNVTVSTSSDDSVDPDQLDSRGFGFWDE